MNDNLENIYEFLNERIKYERIENDYEKRKAEEDVFDRKTVMIIYELFSHGYMDIIDFPIKIGKEANIFRVKKGRRYYALKIYRTSTLNFNSIIKYIEGDYRFEHIKRTKSGLISIWAQKEFRNLTDCFEAGVNVPKPITFKQNVILMQYLGTKTNIAPILKDAFIENLEKTFYEIRDNLITMVNIANLVHGDLSEYNIVFFKEKPYIIDVSQALPVKHPNSRELLLRDVKNIVRFFNKHGLKINEKDMLDGIEWRLFG
ncbi:MAG: serine protein kinase RIO [Thermoplasmata archaeon]|nr:serine protein kinase RIO [Thermoplasmata archaeon]